MMKTFKFELHNGNYCNIEYTFDAIGYGYYLFEGKMYTTSKSGLESTHAVAFERVFASEQSMIKWAQEFIKGGILYEEF